MGSFFVPEIGLNLAPQVADQSCSLSLHACQQTLNQCALREEWRCGREQTLLGSIGATNLISCSDPEVQRQQQQQLTDQLKAMRQVQGVRHLLS